MSSTSTSIESSLSSFPSLHYNQLSPKRPPNWSPKTKTSRPPRTLSISIPPPLISRSPVGHTLLQNAFMTRPLIPNHNSPSDISISSLLFPIVVRNKLNMYIESYCLVNQTTALLATRRRRRLIVFAIIWISMALVSLSDRRSRFHCDWSVRCTKVHRDATPILPVAIHVLRSFRRKCDVKSRWFAWVVSVNLFDSQVKMGLWSWFYDSFKSIEIVDAMRRVLMHCCIAEV